MNGRNYRSIVRKEKSDQNPYSMEFPKNRDGLIYVRQSSLVQQQNNIHSFEMQTDKFVEHFRTMGCTGHIEIIADDEAMSGTLDIHKRPGMTRMMKLIESGAIGWIGAVAINRFTRDPWLITPGTLMKECYEQNVWIATLRMNFNFKDTYSQRVFMLEAEEAARHLDWMKLVLGGGRSAASDKGLYDGRFLVPGYIVDRSDLKQKRYIVYQPHAEIVIWLFKRFFELDGNLRELCREVEQMPCLFPRFESWVNIIDVKRLRIKPTSDGNYKPTEQGIKSILTNPVYIGWWLPLDGGVVKNNHKALIENWLFVYAHKQLSTYDLHGERQKPERVTRNGQVEALLKKVIKSTQGRLVYASPDDGGRYRCIDQSGVLESQEFTTSIAHIDSMFLEKFLKRLRSWKCDDEDWEEKIEEKQVNKDDKKKLIRKAITDAELKMNRITQLLIDSNESTEGTHIDESTFPDSLLKELVKQYKGLETKKQQLEQELQEGSKEEDDEEIQYQIQSILPDIANEWENLAFQTKMRIVKAFVHSVVLDHPSPGWLKMQIEWKITDWGVDTGYTRRVTNKSIWRSEEEAILREKYPNRDALEILQVLPDRTWKAVRRKATKLNIQRNRHLHSSIAVEDENWLHISLQDKEYAITWGLDPLAENPHWL